MTVRKVTKKLAVKKKKIDTKRPSTLGLTKRPFRGKTPVNVFQMVEFGAGGAHNIASLAYKHKNKHFIAVDPIYKKTKINTFGMPKSTRTMESFIKEMKRRGVVARSLMIRGPNPDEMRARKIKLEVLFKEAHNILIPNGKIYITSEFPEVLDLVEFLAKDNGLKVRARKKIKYPKSDIERQSIEYGRPVYMSEITYGLKTAFPGIGREAKSKRHNWTRE